MKTKILFIFFLLFFSCATKVSAISSEQAREILQSHFIELTEVKKFYPDIPDVLEVPFTKETLRKNKSAWMIPVKINSKFKYLLIRANFENEFCALKNIDTLDLKTATEFLIIIKELRPWFPDRAETDLPFKYFFRTDDRYNQKINYKKAISYDGKNFIIVDWPDEVELGMMNKDYISYLIRNKKGVEIQFETTPLPRDHPKTNEQQSVLVLTLFSCKN
jgi:hypothetical protein